ncbi:hypothetical protein EDC04DRAFT_2599639 [Pisolithus marmoratus]|nr:hypothetical protein EDC04DRAFT_2599639 [Pisolithus marmoratus]
MVGGAYPSYTTSTVKKGIASPQHSNQLPIGGNAPASRGLNTPGSGGGISAEMTFTSFFMGLMIEKWTSVITENFLQRPALVSKQAGLLSVVKEEGLMVQIHYMLTKHPADHVIC